MKRHLPTMCFVVSFFATVVAAQDASLRNAADGATRVIRPEQIRSHVRFLSDTLLQGREPGSRGYDIAARYVATQLEGMGLHPGVSAGWYQSVPLLKAVADASA